MSTQEVRGAPRRVRGLAVGRRRRPGGRRAEGGSPAGGPLPPPLRPVLPPPSPRLLYPLELAIDVLQPAFTCSLVHCLYPPAAAAGALRAFATILLGNGVLALAVRSQTSPLPFRCGGYHSSRSSSRSSSCCRPSGGRAQRGGPCGASCLRPWLHAALCICLVITLTSAPSSPSPHPCRWQLPAILATAATLLAHTRTFCGSALLQHGVATLHALLHLLLPIIAPAFIELAPPEGFGVLWARGHDASAGGAALCAAYHVPSVVLGCAALAAHLYAAEAQQRKAFMAESGTAADGRARA